MSGFEPPKYLASLTAVINDGAKAAQTGALAFALIGLYLLATAFSATDENLLLNQSLVIAQLGAQIPVMVSFAMMPLLFVALHVLTLVRYDMLAANVQRFGSELQAVSLLVDRERCLQLLANVEFIQHLIVPIGSAQRSRLFGFITWVVIAGFPVVVLLAVQINALRYQSEIVTGVQRVCLLADLAALFWFFNRQRGREDSGASNTRARLRRWGMCLWMPVVVVFVNIVWMDIAGPGPNVGDVQHSQRYNASLADAIRQPLDAWLCPHLNWGCRFLRVDHRTLVGKVWDNKVIVELGAQQPPTPERRAAFEGVFLRQRSLRFADLSESRLYGADMIEVDLRFANMYSAKLVAANLFDANLSGASLRYADLRGANLKGANLADSQFEGANLSEADLTSANLQVATLDNANLRGVNLTKAKMRSASLRGAEAIGANLSEADLTKVDLLDANLSEANLTKANFTFVNWTGAILERANLSGSNLSRAFLPHAKLSGANLSGANLSRANLSNADLSYANMRETDLTEASLTGAYLKDADLTGAKLSGANLSKAILLEAILTEEQLETVCIYKDAPQPIGKLLKVCQSN